MFLLLKYKEKKKGNKKIKVTKYIYKKNKIKIQ